MLKKLELIMVVALVLVFYDGAALAAKDEKPAGLIERTVLIQKKFNTFNENKLKELRGKIDLANFDRMVGYIAIDKKRESGKYFPDHGTYRFNGLTSVTGKKGEKMTMEGLVVPSRIKIYYYPNTRKAPMLYAIEVVKTFKSGDRAWSVPDPE